MAILWQKTINGDLYQVRNAGKTLRLYTNDVFHTQYNPNQPLTGHVWDLLMLPAFFHAPGTIKRALVLGVGGGSVIHLLRKYVKPVQIVGVELDAVHLMIARRFFNVNGKDIRLHRADAIRWIKNYNGEKFDLIIEDLFQEQDGHPVPVVPANRAWFERLLRHVSGDGMIIRNFVDQHELKTCAALTNQAVNNRFKSIYQLTSFFKENYVGVFARSELSSQQLRKRLIATPGLNPALKTSRLRYSLRRLS